MPPSTHDEPSGDVPSEDPNLPRPRPKLSPPDPAYTYSTPFERMAGAGIDLVFLHIILIPLSTPAADLSFEYGSVIPAAIFTGIYFLILLLFMHFKGLTPGGVPLKYRVVNHAMNFPSWGQCLRRLAPYVAIELGGLWHLHVAIHEFVASGDPYEFENLRAIIREHGGFWRALVGALNAFIIADLLFILPSPRNQSISDKLAGTFVVARSA